MSLRRNLKLQIKSILHHNKHDHHDRLFNCYCFVMLCVHQVVIYCMDSVVPRKTTFWLNSIDESRIWRRNLFGSERKRSLDSLLEHGNGLMVIKIDFLLHFFCFLSPYFRLINSTHHYPSNFHMKWTKVRRFLFKILRCHKNNKRKTCDPEKNKKKMVPLV